MGRGPWGDLVTPWHVGWDLGAHDLWSMIALFHGTVTATADCVTVTSGGITDG